MVSMYLVDRDIDAGSLDSGVGCLPCGFEQRVELGIEAHRPGTIDDVAIYLRAEVYLHDVPVL